MTDQRERNALETLNTTFKHAQFRSNTQKEAVLKVVEGISLIKIFKSQYKTYFCNNLNSISVNNVFGCM